MEEEYDSTPLRASTRTRKSTRRFKYFQNIEEEENSEEKEEKPEKFENNHEDDDSHEKIDWTKMGGEEDVEKAPKYVRPRNNFSLEERRRVFQFILDQCRSKVPGKEGRIAKFKVQTNNGWVWDKFKELYGYERDIAVYRIHFDYYAKKLHTVPGLTLDERVDLYYAMEIPITDSAEKQQIIEKYGVTVDETTNIITASTVCQHWDTVDDGGAPDGEDGEKEDEWHCIREATRYVEFHDGTMWQFICQMINRSPNCTLNYGFQMWEEFKKTHRSGLFSKKSTMSFTTRFKKILLPNLHIMPFDIQTKAALYESLDYPVPHEFRIEIISATGVTLSTYGFIQDYPNRPVQLVLQSKPQLKSRIGILSTTRYSTLREPDEQTSLPEDRRPWSAREDREMWQYVRELAHRADGTIGKVDVPRQGQTHFWWKFSDDVKMERGCSSMAKNFKRLRSTIIYHPDFDIKSKIELHYIVSQPLEPEAIELFKTISILVLNEHKAIRYAIGDGWLIGRTADADCLIDEILTFHFDMDRYQEILKPNIEPDPSIPSSSTAPLEIGQSTVSQQIKDYIRQFEEAERNRTNSQKFLYVNRYHRSRQFLKRQQRLQLAEESLESHEKRSKMHENEPKSDTEHTETQEKEPEELEMKLEPIDEFELENEAEDVVQDEEEMERRPSPTVTSAPNHMDTVVVEPHAELEQAFDGLERIIGDFNEKLYEGAQYLDAQQRLAYKQQLERLTNKFRLHGKQALTHPGPTRRW